MKRHETIINGRYAMRPRDGGDFNLYDTQFVDMAGHAAKVLDNGTEQECREWVTRNGDV